MGKRKRRRARGINSGSSQFRVTPQLIVQVRWSQVSSSNHQPLGITAVTERIRPPSLSSVFHPPASALGKQYSFLHRRRNSSRQNVTLLVESECFEAFQTFYNTGIFFIFGSFRYFHLILSQPIFFFFYPSACVGVYCVF